MLRNQHLRDDCFPTGFERVLIIISRTLDFQHANIQQALRNNYCLLTDSWLLSFASYTVSLTSVSGLAGYSEGKVTPVRNSGSLFACQREGRHRNRVRLSMRVCVCACDSVYLYAHLYCNTHVHKNQEAKGRKRGRETLWVNEPTAGLALSSSSSRRFSSLLACCLSWAHKRSR